MFCFNRFWWDGVWVGCRNCRFSVKCWAVSQLLANLAATRSQLLANLATTRSQLSANSSNFDHFSAICKAHSGGCTTITICVEKDTHSQGGEGGGGSVTGVLLYPTARKASPPGVKNPVTERPPVYVCKRKRGLPMFVIKLFFFYRRNAATYIESNGCCKFFERCSWNVLWPDRRESKAHSPN